MRKDSYTPTTLTASVIIRVRFSETDPLGIVWHGNYIKYFEEGREAFGRKYGLSYLDVQREGYRYPYRKISLRTQKNGAIRRATTRRNTLYAYFCSQIGLPILPL